MTCTILNILFNLKIHKYTDICESSNIKPRPLLCMDPLTGVLYHLSSINYSICTWSTISSVLCFSFFPFMEGKLKDCKTIQRHHFFWRSFRFTEKLNRHYGEFPYIFFPHPQHIASFNINILHQSLSASGEPISAKGDPEANRDVWSHF